MFQTGILKTKLKFIKMNQGESDFDIPVPWFLIKHPAGNIVIDGGNAIEAAIDKRAHWGAVVDAYDPVMEVSENCADQCRSVGVDPGSVRYVLQSHLHLDHTGAIGHFPNAQIICQRVEYDYAFNPHWFARGAYIRALTRTEVDELLVCLEVLTGLSARLAAENVDKGDNRSRFQAVADSLVRFEAVGEDLYRSIRQRVDFYNAMLAVGGNRELARIMPLLQIHQFRTQFHAYHSGSDMQSHFAEYAEIVEGILAGDAKRAERAMKRHIRNTGRRIQSLPDFAFAPEEGG